ncbi:MAG: hypothetical protein IT445_10595 [Phycisphaeraceae bacterium]|nr:hypothetical protein [Phycisphaeraceae bacterium]
MQPSILRSQGLGARIGLSLIVLSLLGGLGISGWYMALHHENRDERPGLTMTDIVGHYHGVNAPSPLLEAINNHHPEDLPDEARQALLDWLRGNRISEDYDRLDLGMMAPAEIMADHCLACHSRQSSGPDAYPDLPLDYWDDVRAVAYSRDIRPVDLKVLAASAHTHAISLAMMALAGGGLLLLTRWPRVLVNLLLMLIGLGLAVDLACWWIARVSAAAVPVLVAAGFVFAGCLALSLLLVLADLWWPHRAEKG